MPPAPKRHRARIVAGYAVLLAVLLSATVPIYLAAGPARRPAVIRLSAAVVLVVGTLNALSAARRRIEDQASSEFERALETAPVEVRMDARFLALRDELRFSARSRSYFRHILWPQLAELATRLRRQSPGEPRGRSFGRGPSLAALSHLIDRLEEDS